MRHRLYDEPRRDIPVRIGGSVVTSATPNQYRKIMRCECGATYEWRNHGGPVLCERCGAEIRTSVE